jgi:S-adenosylmethionine-diacylglycerol 3-amino-3-carboxypropyl transferase
MARSKITRLADRLHDRCFQLVHRNRLIYNTCWEDPRIDRELLEIDDRSRVVVITSAGCNTLDYLLDNPARIDALDVNYRQNALMALKMAIISADRRDLLVQLFGDGRHSDPRAALAAVADALTDRDRSYWRRHIGYFGGRRTFYHRGATGDAAYVFITLFYRFFRGVKPLVDELLSAPDLRSQRTIYERIEPRLWRRPVTWLVKQPTLMAMLGVPRPQMRLIDRQYAGGLPQYVRDRLRHVFTRVPIRDNYFWRVYATGTYSAGCRPNYLKEPYFETLRDRIGRIRLHTDTLTGFLEKNPGIYTHFVLLDHQDWMAWYHPEALTAEWTAILANSRPGTRILMRSAGPDVRFIPDRVRRVLRLRPERTDPLHRQDRVGTYGSLHLAEVS